MPAPKTRARPKPPRRTAGGSRAGAERGRSSWEQVANWYDATVGIRGSPHHRKVAIPTVMRLADPRAGELLLDVGCGQGVLAHHVLKAGAGYLGVDASAAMIRHARKRREGVNFEVGDARDLTGTTSVEPGSCHVVVFLLSVQDMDPLPQVMASAADALAPGGRLVLFMVHPAFRPPRASGWGFDQQRKLTYRRIERYLTPSAVPMKEYVEVGAGPRGATISFHRPLQEYFAAITAAGLVVDALEEFPDPVGEEHEKGSGEIPLFLALRARRLAR
ncbi:MAG: class I SAM-dependent methyltransferase [Trueperaceae bacterium]|nr:class I SAM-dependent methyltransferase [Trueperaceae bacterium]